MSGEIDRRPLASRDTGWARAMTRWLAATSVTPNQISMLSMVAAAVAGASFWASAGAAGASRIGLLLLAALFCQLRLLCNLMDGLVALEGGKQAKDGPFWNEFPDRVSDLLILVGLGLAGGDAGLGWSATALAILTAYVRELGRANGAPSDFSGPMAKPQRMAIATVAALASLADPLWNGQGMILRMALWLIVLGAAITALRRAARLVACLKAR